MAERRPTPPATRPRKATRSRTATRAKPATGAGTTAPVKTTPAASPATRPVGGITLDTSPAGLATTTLEADVSDELARVAPTFGNVLSSIGLGVATSQTALDKGVIDTVKKLSDKKITVVTDVIEVLDDDGLPDIEESKLVTHDLSVLNFFTPTVHEWKTVRISMDLSVGEMDNQSGLTFERKQRSASQGAVGLLWGFVGWMSMSDSESSSSGSTKTRQEVDWSQGQVRLDALLGPRRTDPFPAPASVAIGPQIYFSQGAVTETTSGATRTRSVSVVITVRKADGSANPAKTIALDAGGLLPSFESSGAFNGSTTNPDGQVKVKLSRSMPLAAAGNLRTRVTATLGQLSAATVIVL